MRIRISELRRIIRESLKQDADVPGRWRANDTPIDPEELDNLGDSGFGDEFPEEIDPITVKEIKSFVKSVIAEGPAGPGVTSDPTSVEGFYPYELERGNDIQGYWYKSPGDKGSNDPGRPEDAEEYIGFKTKGATPADAAAEAAPPTDAE